MDVHKPLHGVPQTLLWAIFGVACLILGVYFINIGGFPHDIQLSTSWTFLGLFLVLTGFFVLAVNIIFWIVKVTDILKK